MAHHSDTFFPLNIQIITVSDTRSLSEDTSGDYLQEAAQNAGHHTLERILCRDDIYILRAKVSQAIADAHTHVVMITGGTGLYDRDTTPEAVRVLFDKEVPGFGEQFRHISAAEIGTATIQSRALAGIANHTLILCLPGSTGACKTAWENIICSQLDSRTRPCSFYRLLTER